MAEPTGFEPAIFGVTVRCVKPGYTTVPRSNGRGGKIRTRDLRFWRPPLYQLSYTPTQLLAVVGRNRNRFVRPWIDDYPQVVASDNEKSIGEMRDAVKGVREKLGSGIIH